MGILLIKRLLSYRQRRYFYYLTGCNLADCFFTYDIASSKSTLYIPPIDPHDVIWSGLPTTIDDALRLYDVDEVKLTTEVNASLAHLAGTNPTSTVYAIQDQVSDHVTFIGFDNKDFELLKPAIEVSRVVKDEFEVAMIRKANAVSSAAHKAVVEKAKQASNERELEAVFLERCAANGAKEMAYHPIVASGTAAATLHYVPNDAPLGGKQLLLIDAGAEWNNYAADIVSSLTPHSSPLLTGPTVTDQNLSPQRQVHQGGPRNLRHRLQDAAGVHCRHQGRHALGRRPRAGPQDCH